MDYLCDGWLVGIIGSAPTLSGEYSLSSKIIWFGRVVDHDLYFSLVFGDALLAW